MDAYPTALPSGMQLVQDPVNLQGLEPEYHDIVCIGGGMSGVSLACKLKMKYGRVPDMAILERLAGPAGTWEANTYPGCACDIPALVYSFSFRQKTDWSSFFPHQPEIREYVRTVVAEYGISDLFRYHTVAIESRFDPATSLWHVISATFDPKNPTATPTYTHYVSKLLVTAVGGLSEPNKCDIPGHETFRGAIFHSACWDHSVDLKNKHVIVVGNGCSATQIVPEIVKEAKHVTQFVRSKHWYAPLPQNDLPAKPWFRWMLRNVPFFMSLLRLIVWLILESHFAMALRTRKGERLRANWEKVCRAYVAEKAPAKYHEQLVPKEKELMVACRRRVLDSTYLPALSSPNLDLLTTKLERIEEDAVWTADGRRIAADVIVLANGFSPKAAGAPLTLRGKDLTIQEHYAKYGEGSQLAYRSIFLSGFPNMGMLVGPNSGTGHMSVVYTSERQQELLLTIADPVLTSSKPSQAAIQHVPGTPASSELVQGPTYDVKIEAELAEQHWIVKRMKELVFSTCDSWYRDAKSGRVTAVYPDWQWKLALRCWFPVWKDYVYTHLPHGQKHARTTLWQKLGCALHLGGVPHVDPSETPEIHREAMGV